MTIKVACMGCLRTKPLKQLEAIDKYPGLWCRGCRRRELAGVKDALFIAKVRKQNGAFPTGVVTSVKLLPFVGKRVKMGVKVVESG